MKISPFNVFCVAANGELRVVRGCGWIPNEKNFEGRDCFTRTGTNKVQPWEYSLVQPSMSILMLVQPVLVLAELGPIEIMTADRVKIMRHRPSRTV